MDAPRIEKRGTLACDLVEATPVVFRDRLYRCLWVRTASADNRLGRNYGALFDWETNEQLAPVGEDHVFHSAWADDERIVVLGTSTEQGWTGDTIRFWSTVDPRDPDGWTPVSEFKLPGYGVCNTSLTRVDDRWGLMFEIHLPKDEAGTAFTARFAFSDDLVEWETTPPECVYAKDRYTAPHCFRALDGWYYDFYLEAFDEYVTHVVRSRDLVHWEQSPFNPVLRADDDDRIIADPSLSEEERERIATAEDVNNSDIDFCEHDGRLVITYSWGHQRGIEHLAWAEFDGTEAEFLRGWFPENPD